MAVSTVPGPGERQATDSGRGWAWGLCSLMLVSTAIGYTDRMVIALVGPQLRAEFQIRDTGFGWILASFSMSYALFHLAAGHLADRWPTRGVYAGAVGVWSLAAVATGLAPSLAVLMTCHAVLGLGEAFNWPCASKITGRILPPAERGLGAGIFNAGAALGAVVTTLAAPLLTRRFGWRATVVGFGLLGFLWVVPWLAASRRLPADNSTEPRTHGERLPLRTRAVFAAVGATALGVAASSLTFGIAAIWSAIALLVTGLLASARLLPAEALSAARWTSALGVLVRLRRFWVLVPVAISVNVSWHFLANWVPTYLEEDRRMSYLAGGMLSALPFLAGGLGNFAGGAASKWVARFGTSPAQARIWVAAVASSLIHAGAWLWAVPNDAAALALLAVMAFGSTAFMANFLAFNQEVAPEHTGMVVGLLGGIGELFTAGFFPVAGWVRDSTGSFTPAFVVVGLLPLVGLASLALGWRDRPASGEEGALGSAMR